MKTIRMITAIIFTLFISSYSLAADGGYAAPAKTGGGSASAISMDFQNANLKTVLKIFSQQSGLNFVASDSVKDRTVTIYFDSVSVEDALQQIMDANNLVYEQEAGSSIFIVRESGRPAVEVVTKIYELKYTQLVPPMKEGDKKQSEPEIIGIIKTLLSKKGTVVVDKRSNSLIVSDVPTQFAMIEDVISRLDVRVPQVMIEVEIIETTTDVTDKLGVNWSETFGVYTGPVHSTVWPLRGDFAKDTPGLGEGITTAGSVSFSGLSATLYAILSNQDTHILARPKVLTLNNEAAIIELTAETSVATITTSSDTGAVTTTSEEPERIDTGVTLQVTPQVNKEGYITMNIEPSVTVPILSEYFDSGSTLFLDPHTRSTKTTVRVRDGETVVIGGLISKNDVSSFQKVPILGDIPLLGHAFRYKTKNDTDRELLVFITPRIVREKVAVLKDVSEREQETPEVIRKKEIKKLLDLLGGE